MNIELLYFDGCPTHERLLPRLQELLRDLAVADEVRPIRIDSSEAAMEHRFLGSPTVRIDGHDIDPTAATRTDYGLECRLYASADGLVGVPPDEMLRAAIVRARDDACA
ncbi:MAG: hypothetical protein AB7I24_06470 [Candidatus Nanopelagicales bacterium]